MEDRSQFRLQVTAPEGTAYDYMDNYVIGLRNFMLDSVPEKNTVFIHDSTRFCKWCYQSGFVRVTLVDPKERTRSQKQIVDNGKPQPAEIQ